MARVLDASLVHVPYEELVPSARSPPTPLALPLGPLARHRRRLAARAAPLWRQTSTR